MFQASLILLAAVAAPPMSIIGRYSMAQACAVDGYVISAAHVVERVEPGDNRIGLGYVFQQGDRAGFLTPSGSLFSRDLGFFVVDFGTVAYSARAASDPKPGDKVYWYEYDMKKSPLRVIRQDGKITGVLAGHFSFKPEPQQGASGGCVFSAANEALGIVTWSVGYPGTEGVGVLITGEWWQ